MGEGREVKWLEGLEEVKWRWEKSVEGWRG